MKRVLFLFAALFCAFGMNAQVAKSQITLPVNGQFIMPELPYEMSALEPVISAETMEYHYGKHFKGYIDNLNRLIKGTELENLSLEEVVKRSEGGIFNNAGQALNHKLYFAQFKSPVENNRPEGSILEALNRDFGSYEEFVAEFDKVATGLFGSGWVFLSSDEEGKLHITKSANGSNSIVDGLRPLLAFDLWEHAYYLDYRNQRAKHLAALWSIVDWSVVEERYLAQ